MTPDIDFSDSNFVDDILENCNNLRTRATKAEASLAEAEALTRRNVELMNSYLARIAELEAQILHQTAISACRIEERERHQKQIAALQEIATGERAYILSVNVMESTGVDEFHRTLANHQLSEEHPEAFR